MNSIRDMLGKPIELVALGAILLILIVGLLVWRHHNAKEGCVTYLAGDNKTVLWKDCRKTK